MPYTPDASLLADDDTFEETMETLEVRVSLMNNELSAFKALAVDQRTLVAAKLALEQHDVFCQEIKLLDRRVRRLAGPDNKSHRYFVTKGLESAHNQYFIGKRYFTELIHALNSNPPPAAAAPQPSSSLPFKFEKIKLPRFNGESSKWINYRNLWLSTIQNDLNSSEVQKFHLLRASLDGEAFALIENIKGLFSIKKIKNELSDEVRCLYDETTRACEQLANIGRKVDQWNDLLVYLTVNKLDVETCKYFELHANSTKVFPTLDQIKKFLDDRALRLSRMPVTPSNLKTHQKYTAKALHSSTEPKVVCPACDYERKECENTGRCRYCKRKHHSLLCNSRRQPAKDKNHSSAAHATVDSSDSESVTSSSSSDEEIALQDETLANDTVACQVSPLNAAPENSILLATAIVRLRSKDGRTVSVRALLHQGSQLTFVSKSIAQARRAPRTSVDITIAGVNGTRAASCRSAITCELLPGDGKTPILSITAHVLPKLTSFISLHATTGAQWNHLKGLKLADPINSNKQRIELIIGASLYPEVILEGTRKGPANTPLAQEALHCTIREPVDTLIRQFWELEISTTIGLNKDEQKCENHFKETHSRRPDGRYSVHLPLKGTLPLNIGESYRIAFKCLERQRTRLRSTPHHQIEYDKFLQEYLDLGHMEPSPEFDSENLKPVYLPHHAVLRKDSTTSPLRVVFNASSKTTNHTTLNDHLLIGPQLLPDLFDVILRWRMHPVALRADVEKMFRQILVDPEERHLQRILWREPTSHVVKSFDLKTVTYGTAPVPYVVNRVLKQLAPDERHSYPRAATILQRDFYVDNALFGANSVEEAQQLTL
ncbi:uncharacterized protein LOC107042148 [Diachasma alloeum]|uniref:uncharacterized protein LOC107042148 n=1 Tax=Diachasma alloeum TaxID=454923 RepID=UPI0007383257|nr:uncharacterized protein LOC107042148 [Diachasma alloeum]